MGRSDRVVLVTGGSRGIGAAVVRTLGTGGAQVYIASRSAPDDDLIAATGARFLAADVTDADRIASVVEEVVADAGRLDCAVNCAGHEGVLCRLEEYPDEECLRVFEVNFMGVFLALKHEVRAMMARRRGAIVNLSSIAGLKGVPTAGPYVASKHAVIGLTRSVALEVAESGIRVNAVCPSLVRTSMAQRLADKSGRSEAELVGANPLGRAADPEEVVGLILWLLSEQASFVTGQAISVDGGEGIA